MERKNYCTLLTFYLYRILSDLCVLCGGLNYNYFSDKSKSFRTTKEIPKVKCIAISIKKSIILKDSFVNAL
ncbi:MAG: hypothetical protein HUU08_17120 [Candidatus Brocadia sp.]|nr:hypothetical protein [Candidatus Brocadia sp.]